jgi:TetR/AcrR family transcriptional regulator, cholesterol catabolism regulator
VAGTDERHKGKAAVARASRARTASKRVAGTSSRSKREDILSAAAEHFGRQGYEDTKWADIAADVGVGSTALYHYFESKLHCLFEIMSDTLESFRHTFDEVTQSHERFEDGLVALLHANFALSDAEVARCRVLVAEQGRLSQTRRTEREEEARQRARSRVREMEVVWSNFLSRGMATGAIPEADPQLLTRAVLGLYNSVWHWYRPRGTLSLSDVEEFYVPRMLVIVGLEPIEALRTKAAA